MDRAFDPPLKIDDYVENKFTSELNANAHSIFISPGIERQRCILFQPGATPQVPGTNPVKG